MGHSGLLLYKKWGSSGTPSEMGDNYIHNYYCHLYIWLERRETSNTYHTGQRTEQTFPTMNISSSSNGFSLTGGLPPVPCFLFSLMKNYFFMLLNFLRTWSEVWRQTPQLLTFPAMSCHSWPFSWLVTSPVKALWIMTLLPPPQGAQWFPGVYSLVFWPILPSADPFLPCGRKRRYQLTCMHRGSNNEAFFSTSLKCAELSPSGKCALQCKKWSSSSVCSALLLCSSTLVPCTGVLWVQKSRSPLLRAQSCQRFSL